MNNGTQYEEIYKIFLRKITDFDLMGRDDENLEYMLEGFLGSAIANFPECKELYYRDDKIGRFECDLSLIIKEALAYLMLVQWMKPKIHNVNSLEQFLGDSEFKTFSQANHIDKLRALDEHIYNEADRLKKSYGNLTFDMDNLR